MGAFGESVLRIPTAPRNVIMGAPRGALGARHDSVSVVKGVNELAKRKAESLVKEAWMALAGEELENAQELVEQARQEWSLMAARKTFSKVSAIVHSLWQVTTY